MARFLASNDPPPRTFRFGSEQFAPWSDEISPVTRGTLSTIELILKSYPNAQVTLTGYTDNDGDAQANQVLSERRAATLRHLLIDQGIAGPRITAQGKGPADPRSRATRPSKARRATAASR